MADPFDYLTSRDDADELIADFGQAVLLRRLVSGGTESEPTQTPTDYGTYAAIIDYSDDQIDGENILRTDRRALVAAGPLNTLGINTVRAPDSIVLASGEVLSVVPVKPLNPAGVVVMFDCQVRV